MLGVGYVVRVLASSHCARFLVLVEGEEVSIWSKAPAKATHYGREFLCDNGSKWLANFYQRKQDGSWFILNGRQKGDNPMVHQDWNMRVTQLEARP